MVTPEEMENWQQDQTTRKVVKFFKDFAENIAQITASEMLLKFRDGYDIPEKVLRDRAIRVQVVRDFLDLDADTINKFYAPDEEQGR